MKKNENEETLNEVEFTTLVRKTNPSFYNLYIYLDGFKFELVPHVRTVQEKALFYGVLKRKMKLCPLPK